MHLIDPLSLEQLLAANSDALIIYSGRSEELIGPLINTFNSQNKSKVRVRYGKTAEMAALILEEGKKSPADVFFAQDAGALGALAKANRLERLSEITLHKVNKRFRSKDDLWVGVSGRARVVVYNTKKLTISDLPRDIFGFCDPEWKNRIGWAPTNGSFQAFVTAIRKIEGEENARRWLLGIQKNAPISYPKNTPIVAAVGSGEIDVGFVNHYYLHRFTEEFGKEFDARNYYIPEGKSRTLINVAGVGILVSSKRKDIAESFIQFLLSPESQNYFTNKTFEYPLVEGIKMNALLSPLMRINTPALDLSALEDLSGTLELLQELGIL